MSQYVYVLTNIFHWKMLMNIYYRRSKVDRMGFEPMASCLQSRRSSADLPAHLSGPATIKFHLIYFLINMCFWCLIHPSIIVGGDPSAGSPTDTLLRLNPAY
jgi:hypothetical protein